MDVRIISIENGLGAGVRQGIGIYLVKSRGHTHGNKKVIRANFG